jgi:branched-chain amino acid transport system substrate-binding protein
MQLSSRALSRAALIGAATVALALTSTGVPQAQNEKYVLGAVLSISGSGASLGQPAAEALKILVKSVNDKGGIKGHQLELRLQDDGGDTQRSRAAMTQLADDPNVFAIIGSSQSPPTLAIKPIANAKKVALLSLASSPLIVNPVTPYVFQMPVPTHLRAGALFADMKKNNIRKVALFVSNDDYGQSSEKVVEGVAKAAGISIEDTEQFNPLGTNADSEVVRAKSKNVDAFVVFSVDPGSALVAKSMVNQGMTMVAYGDSPAATPSFLHAAGAAAGNWRIVTTKIDVASLLQPSDPLKAPIDAFRKLYPTGQVPNHFSGTARDAFVVATDALAKAGPNRTKVRDAIEATRGFVGVTGVYSFTPQNHQPVDAEGLALISGDGASWKLAK